jgi:hypothetical protein
MEKGERRKETAGESVSEFRDCALLLLSPFSALLLYRGLAAISR